MNKQENPKVTVLMPVYNGEKYLKESIDSILNQSYSNFEFLIINDGSTDKTDEIINLYTDERIKYINDNANWGLVKRLNFGIKKAKGEYIVRMDDDDISLPDRIATQVAFMDLNPQVGICGTWSRTFGDNIKSWDTKYPIRHSEIKAHFLLSTAISHPTAIFRKAFFTEFKLEFSEEAKHYEDYQLFNNALDHFQFANIPQILFEYRINPTQISSMYSKEQSIGATTVRKQILKKINISPSEEEIKIHMSIATENYEKNKEYISNISKWLSKIYIANKQIHYYENSALRSIFYKHWLNICILNQELGFQAIYWHFQNSMFRLKLDRSILRFLIKSFIVGIKQALNI